MTKRIGIEIRKSKLRTSGSSNIYFMTGLVQNSIDSYVLLMVYWLTFVLIMMKRSTGPNVLKAQLEIIK